MIRNAGIDSHLHWDFKFSFLYSIEQKKKISKSADAVVYYEIESFKLKHMWCKDKK